jgi:hypothetical protein
MTNIGRGQAVDCYYVSRQDADWCWSRNPGLSGEERAVFNASPGSGEIPWELLSPSPHDADQTTRLPAPMFCKDIFGNRIRFLVGREGRDVHHPDDPNPPAWATSPIVWT